MTPSDVPVVVAVSGDQPAVVAYALREATRLGAAVRVVHCASSDRASGIAAAGVVDAARRVVEVCRAPATVEYVVLSGDPVTVLLAEARDAQALVVGAADGSWLDRMLGGDVSGQLVLRATCPVVVVPHSDRADDPAGGVVVTLDGDTSSSGPLAYGFEQAASRPDVLRVLHAAPVGTSRADTSALTARVGRDVGRWIEQAPTVRVQLSTVDGVCLGPGLRAAGRASLLVIGRPHGRSHEFALARPVAMAVLREAGCPVVIVPADYAGRRRVRQ